MTDMSHPSGLPSCADILNIHFRYFRKDISRWSMPAPAMVAVLGERVSQVHLHYLDMCGELGTQLT